MTTVAGAAGLPLAKDLPARPGQMPLLRAGAVVSERYGRALADQGIHTVWVEDELSEGIEPDELLPDAARAEAAGRFQHVLAAARQAHVSSQPLPPEAMQEVSRIVAQITEQLPDGPDAALVLNDLAPADQYLQRHPVNVTALGLLLAREHFGRVGWVDSSGERHHDRIEQRLSLLGTGLLLLDIGTITIPAELLTRRGPLDDDEWALMRGHPEAGVRLLNPRSTSPLVVNVVRDHHERMDGSGYPRGIAGDDIHEFARIAAVADVYDAITYQRPFQDASRAHIGVRAIAEGAGSQFDADLVATFRALVSPFPVGTEMRLRDGRVGVVARIDPAEPDVPLVRVADGGTVAEVAIDTRSEAIVPDG
jgi:HD-GYP domain-containing protein (c-di-GMP phosphodiesterase class II)